MTGSGLAWCVLKRLLLRKGWARFQAGTALLLLLLAATVSVNPPIFSGKPPKQFHQARPTHAWVRGPNACSRQDAPGRSRAPGSGIRVTTSGRLGAHTRCLGHPPGWGIVFREAKRENLPSATDNRSTQQQDALLSIS